jgi:7-cyano-7-deazaguanine synthase
METASLFVHEIYNTIQGETTYSGLPCVMVRLAGCNLSCTYCDTPQAKSGGRKMTIGNILAEVARFNPFLVEVTGGEPLLQEETPLLLKALLDAGHKVLLETNGSFSLDSVPSGVIKICDIKCPGSGEADRNRWENIALLTDNDQIKFVLCDREDYDWAKNTIQEHGLSRFELLLSPVSGTLDPQVLASWILEDRLNVRLQLQLHKIVWPEGEKKSGDISRIGNRIRKSRATRGKRILSPETPRAVVLLSGGLDSTTALALAKKDGFEIYALTFNYGQKHAIEVNRARRIAETLGVVEHRVMDLDLASLAHSALTSDQKVPKNREQIGGDIPPTYVPARNLIFLSCAAAWAETLQSRNIFIGISCADYSGYPDCRSEFIESFRTCVNAATKTGVEGNPIKVNAPFLYKTKAEIVKMGLDMNLDYSLTHSCYDPRPDGSPCGGCDSCILRRRAFEELGLAWSAG